MPSDTKERILDSAELLFAEHGIAGTSLRALTDHAGVNLAAVNYHFQSKDALVQAVLFRLMNPVNQRRLQLLQEELQKSEGPRLEGVLEALFRPVVEEAVRRRRMGRPIGPLFARLYTEPGELMTTQVRSLMGDVAREFAMAFQRVLPEVPQETLLWRMHCSIGVLTHLVGASELIQGITRGQVRLDDPEEILRNIIAYAAGGFRGVI